MVLVLCFCFLFYFVFLNQRYFLIHNQSVSFGIFIEIELSMQTPKFCQHLNCVSWRSQRPSIGKSCPVLISNAGRTIESCRSPLQPMKRHNQHWTCFCWCSWGQHCCCGPTLLLLYQMILLRANLLNVGSKLLVVRYSIDGAEPAFVTVTSTNTSLISIKAS